MVLDLHVPIISYLIQSVKQISDVFPYQNSCMETFGERLRASRKAAKMSQASAAKAIGVSQGLISDLENNVYESSSNTIKLATLYKVNPSWLATGKGTCQNAPLTPEESEMMAAFRTLPPDQQVAYRIHIINESKMREALNASQALNVRKTN